MIPSRSWMPRWGRLQAAGALLWMLGCGGGSPAPSSVTLALALLGNGGGRVQSSPAGIDCGTSCSAAFSPSASVTLSAAPDAGSTFGGWGGDCSGTAATAQVTLDVPRSCTATFAKIPAKTWPLAVNLQGTGTGRVQSAPAGIDCGTSCSASFTDGTAVTLTPVAAAGSSFAGWGGDCAGSAAASVAMTAARSCTATFNALPTFPLAVTLKGNGAGRVSSNPSGIDCGSNCSAALVAGTNATLTATAGAGSQFGGWGGSCTGSASTAQVSMSAARSCTATFVAAASHPAFPQMPSHGQAPFTKLQLVTITFAGYPYKNFVESFGDFVVGSQWLSSVTQDFGPIPATHLAKVSLPASAASQSYDQILLNNLGGAIPFPTDHTGLIYLFYQPAPCTTAGGYHGSVNYQGTVVAFAVALNCSDGKSAEGVASHEIAETLTDGYANGLFFDATSAPWTGENGDICNDAPWWEEGGYRFAGIWSNGAAAAGGSPCVPWPSGVAYNNVSVSPQAPQTVAAGGTVTFTLTGWSTGDATPWSLSLQPDAYAQQDFDTTPTLSSTSINVGTSVQLTLHVPAGTPSGKKATLRVGSLLPVQVEGIAGFSGDWSLQVIAQ